jgi:hypothetical protein
MKAELYIITESFVHNDSFSNQEIEEKVKALAKDFIEIKRNNSTNKLFIHPDIYNVNFLQDIPLSELLYNPSVYKQIIDRDVYNALQKIVIESAITYTTSQEVIEVLLQEHNDTVCHGIIAFHLISGIDADFQIVYNLNNWYKFRRHFLGLYPKNPVFFIDECINYFPQLFFHEDNKISVGAILYNCSKKIIYHLSALNDNFKQFFIFPYSRINALQEFSIFSNLDEMATTEGNADRKPALTFKFRNDKDILEEVCCEPHLKLCYNDNYPGDNSYSNDRRIYFHEGKANIQNNKILIGHIGRHL